MGKENGNSMNKKPIKVLISELSWNINQGHISRDFASSILECYLEETEDVEAVQMEIENLRQ